MCYWNTTGLLVVVLVVLFHHHHVLLLDTTCSPSSRKDNNLLLSFDNSKPSDFNPFGSAASKSFSFSKTNFPYQQRRPRREEDKVKRVPPTNNRRKRGWKKRVFLFKWWCWSTLVPTLSSQVVVLIRGWTTPEYNTRYDDVLGTTKKVMMFVYSVLPERRKKETLLHGRKRLADFNDPVAKRKLYQKVLKNKPIYRIYNHTLPYLRRVKQDHLYQLIVDVRHELWMSEIRKNGRHKDYSKIYERELKDMRAKLYGVIHERALGLNVVFATDDEFRAEDDRIAMIRQSEKEGTARNYWNGGEGGQGEEEGNNHHNNHHYGSSGFLGDGGVGGQGRVVLGPITNKGLTDHDEAAGAVVVPPWQNNPNVPDGTDWFYGGVGRRTY